MGSELRGGVVKRRRTTAAGALAVLMLWPTHALAQPAVASPMQWARSFPASAIPELLVRLRDAGRGSPEAAAGRALIARWAALRSAQRAEAGPSLDLSLSALSVRDAARVAFLLPLFDGREERLASAVQAWAQTDTAACVGWIAARRPGPAREAAVRAVAALGETMASPDAAAWAARELPPGAIREAALASALSRWSAENPSAAADWAQGALEEPLRERALAVAIEVWGRHDARAAREWLDGGQSLEASTADAARAGLAHALAASKPTEALAIAANVTAPEQRQQLLQGGGKRWHAPISGEAKAPAAAATAKP